MKHKLGKISSGASNEEAKLRLSCKQSSLRSSPEPPRVTPTATNSSAADVIKADTSLLDNEVKRVRESSEEEEKRCSRVKKTRRNRQEKRERRSPPRVGYFGFLLLFQTS